MSEFLQYRRKSISEMRLVTTNDIALFDRHGKLPATADFDFMVSISDADLANGSPRLGDKIARNPENHNDQWLVAEQYFKDNLEAI